LLFDLLLFFRGALCFVECFNPAPFKTCLLLNARRSYELAEQDIEVLTGISIFHSTHQRLVHRRTFTEPVVSQPIQTKSASMCQGRAGMPSLFLKSSNIMLYLNGYFSGPLYTDLSINTHIKAEMVSCRSMSQGITSPLACQNVSLDSIH